MLTNEKIDTFYRDNLRKFGPGSKGVGWKDDYSQQVRFQQLVKVINTSPFSINDLGCGVGDLFDYLKKLPLASFTYYGYDILNEMVKEAVAIHKESTSCHFYKIENPESMQVADYTLASGIFNPRFGESDEEWKKHILSTLHMMDDRSLKGFSFNALTTYSDRHLMKPELFYADPLWLFDYCKKKFSRNVALLHDYDIYDFTILVKKNF